MQHSEICHVLKAWRGNSKDVSRATLKRHFKAELTSGKARLKSKVMVKWMRRLRRGRRGQFNGG